MLFSFFIEHQNTAHHLYLGTTRYKVTKPNHFYVLCCLLNAYPINCKVLSNLLGIFVFPYLLWRIILTLLHDSFPGFV